MCLFEWPATGIVTSGAGIHCLAPPNCDNLYGGDGGDGGDGGGDGGDGGVCVHECACVRVHACARACVQACVRACVRRVFYMSESIHSARGRNILYTYRVHASSVRPNVSIIE